MLTSLQIKNFALIEDVCIDFTPGFNVFTGETGAGKSILIDAFGVVLGSRASLDYLRLNSDSYWVQAVFDLEDQPNVLPLLEELDIPVEENTLFLRRKVMGTGKSQAFVNDRQVPVSLLQKLGETLVDIHGQHENQNLLKAETPLELVDIYGGKSVVEALAAYKAAYTVYRETTAQLKKLLEQSAHQGDEQERLEREIKEISEANLVCGEEDTLREKVQKLTNHSRIIEAVTLAHGLLNGDDDTTGALDSLTVAKQNLDKAAGFDPVLAGISEAVNSAWITLDDARQTLGSYLSSDEFDTESLNRFEERLDTLFRLKHKYGGSIESVLEYLAKSQEEYEALSDLEGQITKLKKEEAKVLAELTIKAKALTALRLTAAKEFGLAVTKHIHDLAMEQGKFYLKLEELENFTALGKDKAEFFFTANAGMEAKALQKVASGGELSRVALAIKTVLLERYGASTMVFDEIDTGVGGVTAEKMAEKIAIISRCRQVICVTHLAQIASFADNHLHIEKLVRDNQTYTQVEPLGAKERIEEIRRMTGGTNATLAATQNAQELLEAAAAKKRILEGA